RSPPSSVRSSLPCSASPRHLHSFPTRRSSDLLTTAAPHSYAASPSAAVFSSYASVASLVDSLSRSCASARLLTGGLALAEDEVISLMPSAASLLLEPTP